MSHDSTRTRIWFPMFSYFESSVDGIIPNEYDSVPAVCEKIFMGVVCVKDCCMLTARRFWITHNIPMPMSQSNGGGAVDGGGVRKTINQLNNAMASLTRKDNSKLVMTNNEIHANCDLAEGIKKDN